MGARLCMARIPEVACLVPSSLSAYWVQGHVCRTQQTKNYWGWRVVCQARKWRAAMELHRREILRREAAALRPQHCPMKLVAAAEWMEGPEVWQQGTGSENPARAPRA